MTEGSSTVKTKRMGARFFKNPPQPYMCLSDTLLGSSDPCYVNVLSWAKVSRATGSSRDVPLYGGMKVCPPRTEKKDVSVFAVMAHPETLGLYCKNTDNPKGSTQLIDIILDFVEKMNNGVVLNRRYTVLQDRDITGELKEIWMFVQNDRASWHDRSNIASVQEVDGSDEFRRLQYYQEPTSQNQSSQLEQRLICHDEYTRTGQPPRYNSIEFSYDRQDGRDERLKKYGSPNVYRTNGPQAPNSSTTDHYVFHDSIATRHNENSLAYRAMIPPFSSDIRHNAPSPINCPLSGQSTTTTNIVRPEAPIRNEKFTSVKEILETIQPPQQMAESLHVQQFFHKSPNGKNLSTKGAYYNTPNVVSLRPDNTTQAFVIPPDNKFPTSVANLPHYPIVNTHAIKCTSNSCLVPRKQHQKKRHVSKFFADNSTDNTIDRAGEPAIDTLRKSGRRLTDNQQHETMRHEKPVNDDRERRTLVRKGRETRILKENGAIEESSKDRSKDADDRLEGSESNGTADEPTIVKKFTTNTRNNVKIFAGGGSGEIFCKDNGQIDGSRGEQVVHAILRKPEAGTLRDNITSDIARLSMHE